MAYKVLLSPTAIKNIDDTLAYYAENVSKKVAVDFLNDYKRIYKNLQRNPFYAFHDNHYRYLPFKKFPFIAFFIIDETSKTVYLNAIFNTHQNPDKIDKL